MADPGRLRADHEPPPVVAERGWRYHHLGIPTTERREGERYLAPHRLHVSGFSTSPFGIEWMRFEEGCPLHPLLQSVAHVTFEVAMLEVDGAPVELLCFRQGS